MEAFGAPMVRSEGGENDFFREIYLEVVQLKNKKYDLPFKGKASKRFISILTDEIEKGTRGVQKSEVELLFPALILQRDIMVKKGIDIKRLIDKRMDMWEKGLFRELLEEAKRCDSQFVERKVKMDNEHAFRVFNRLMLQGKVREATRFMTNRVEGGCVLNPNQQAEDKTGLLNKSVFEVFKEKHPEPQDNDENAFMSVDELPTLVDVDVTAAHVEKIAARLSGSGGPTGIDSSQWKSWLLRYGDCSLQLREAIAASIRKHANEIVEWDNIRGLLGRRGIALDKCPGVRPIGVGEMSQRIEAKVMALVTGIDIQQECGTENLCA